MKRHIVPALALVSIASLSIACVNAAPEPGDMDDSYESDDLSAVAPAPNAKPSSPSASAVSAPTDGTAVFTGSYVDATGSPQAYSVTAESDGTIQDSEGQTGSYSLQDDVTGSGRVLTLDFGSLGLHILYESPTNCWAEPQSPVNPNLGPLAICLAPNTKAHRLAHYDTQGCADLQIAPITLTAALPQENGHWMGGRLTPTSANGFWAHEVTYVLNTSYTDNTYNCTAADHRVQVFLGDAGAPPPANPTVLHEKTVAGASLGTSFTEVSFDLPAAVYIPAGKSLFVSIEMIRDGVDEVCTGMCATTPGQPDLTFWSDAATAPYAWYDLEPYNFNDIMVKAYGLSGG